VDGALDDEDLAHHARNPRPLDYSKLGACKGTKWPRTCSYWVSMHTMAYRADALHLSLKFLTALMPILASGATMCGGCTLHMQALHKPVLQPVVISDLGPVH